jgi:hypothetical protein
MTTMSWTLSVNVEGGPAVSAAQSAEVEAYDQIEVTVSPGTPKTTIDVSPGASADVKFLLIRLKGPPPYPPKLTYSVGGKGPYALDAPHWLSGSGAVSLLGADPKQFEFSNDAANPAVTVQILVGRDATP